MDRISSQFLRALRGERSQVQLARRLGYRGNPITDWERGEGFPTAEETLRVASSVGIDVPAAFQRFSRANALTRHAQGFALAPWLDALRGATTGTGHPQRPGGPPVSRAPW